MFRHLLLALLLATQLHAALPGSDALAGLILQEFDRDGDARITRGEWEQGAGSSFAMLDANGDGSIAPEEVDILKSEIAAQTGDTTAGVVVALVKQVVLLLDGDNDKLVSKKEYDALVLGLFEKLDADKNQSLTRSESAELPVKLVMR